MKKNQYFKIILVALFLVIIGCKKTEIESKDVEKAKPDVSEIKSLIIAAGENFVIALNRGDSTAVANCYTKDAKMMQPNGIAVIGRSDILKNMGQWIKSESPTLSMKTIDVWADGDLAVAEEEWTISNKEGKILDNGKSLELFKMEEGKWLLYRDCFNSNIPSTK